ncbi:ESPR-type extended signal peptide-containing protein [Megasphaera sp. DISK 18]|uniref:ESPR-type extended signal peptide-containing protein n=1 Tax=Megasphaera sp. DISK 18 TaxID=1776081 RepID=UPI00080719D5|nr:ESPR-type extended signal peptide-containing protein [Megasphaera sp. DISK 18]OBZ32985.1 hypothetical protein A0U42_07965 [Megasphaera sp. DISK 18]
MNRIYKVIWSKVKNCYIVVSEIAKSHSKPVSKGSRQCVSAAAVLAVLALLSVPAGVYAQDGVNTFVDPTNKNIKMGNGISLRNNNGQNGTVAIGDHVQVDDYVMQQGSVAIGTNAFVENMWGGQERTFRFGMTENKDLMAGIAIGQNTYARSGIQIGDHKYIGRLGDTTVDPTTDDGKRHLAIVMGTTTLGHNSYSNGAFTTNTGAFSIMTNGYETGNAMMVGQNFGAVINGSFNSIESKTSSNMYSGIANSVVGTVNRVNNSNGTLIFGAGNEVTNSVENISVPLLGYTPSDAKDLADTLRSNIRGTDGNGTPGGAVLAIGGGNKADYATRSQLSGVGNTLTGTSSSRASYNMLNGYRNKGTTTSYATMIGTLNTITNGINNVIVGNKQKLTGASNNIILGTADSEIETTVSDAVAIGHNSKTTATGGVALGTGSVAATALGLQGYDPSTKANSTSSAIAWKSTAGAVSVGDASNNVTRQITGVAAGTNATDAVNVAQLMAVAGNSSGGSSVHFFSVNGDETQGNYNNDGATGTNAVAIGTGASATQNGGIAIGHISQATGGTAIALGFNANAGGSSTVIGESSIANAPNAGQGIGTVIIGSESADIAGDKEAGASSDVILGGSNRVNESNGVFVRGQGNIVDNSYKQETLTTEDQQKLAAQMFMGTPAGDVYEKLGSHVSVNGDGNYVKNATFSQISGTNNQIVGSDTTSADYNIVTGNRNVVENATNNIVTGDNHTVTGANNNVILGSADTTKEVTVSDTVSVGHNANTTVADSVALGSNSVASVAAGVAGAVPTGATVSDTDKATPTWKSTLGAVSVGVPGTNAAATQTRQITGVAAGTQATDAVNVAQLNAVNTSLSNTVNANKIHFFQVNSTSGTNYDNDGAKGTDSIAIGKATTNASNSIVMGNGAKMNSYSNQPGGIAIGANSFVENMSGGLERTFDFGQAGYDKLPFIGTPYGAAKDPSRMTTGVAIGQNTYARSGAIMLGTHNYKGALGDVTVDSANSKAPNMTIFSTTLGANSYSNGLFSTLTGAYSIASSNYSGGTANATKNFGATINGAFNSVESSTSDNESSGIGNSVIGLANRTSNSNGALIFGAGNEIKNSITNISVPIASAPDSAKGMQTLLMNSIKSSNSGGSTLAIGGANKANYTQQSALIGVNNTLEGTESSIAQYNALTGFNNEATGVTNVTVTGTNNTVNDSTSIVNLGNENAVSESNNTILLGDNRTVSGSDNSIILGRANKEATTTFRAAADTTLTTTADNVVVMGYNANATVADGVALGSNSVANVDKGVAGYNPTTKLASTDTSATWQSTLGAVSVGVPTDNSAATATRQITGVAAGMQDTDAVNVAQLKASQVTLKKGDNVTITSTTDDDGSTIYTIASTDTNTVLAKGEITYSTNGTDGTLVLTDSDNNPVTVTGLKNTFVESAALDTDTHTLTLTRNDGVPIKVTGIATTSDLASNKTHFYSVNSTDEKAGNYNNDGAKGSNALAAGVGAVANTQNSIAIGNSAQILGNGGNSTGTSSIAIGDKAVVTTNGLDLTSIAIGKNAVVLNGSGKQDKALSFTPDNYASGSDLPINADVSPGGIAIGTNAYARTASVQIGNHTMKGYIMGGSEITDQSQANLVGMTTIGSNSYNKGAMGSMLGAYSVMTGDFTGAGGVNSYLYGSQNFGANIVGSLNSIRSAGYSGASGVANSIVGVGNIAENANGALIYGAGNKITNSVQSITGIDTLTSNLTVDQMTDAIRQGIQRSGGGGSTLAVGGGNTADYTRNTAIIGVNNTVSGVRGNVSQYNFVSGYNNTSTGGDNTTIIGTNRTLTGVDNTIVIGSADSTIETTANNAVAIGRNTNVTVDGGVALGQSSIADTDKGVVGYDPSGRITDADSILGNNTQYQTLQTEVADAQTTVSNLTAQAAQYQANIDELKTLFPDTYEQMEAYQGIQALLATTQNDLSTAQADLDSKQSALAEAGKALYTWQSTAGSVSVGDVSKGITRQITDVAAGTADTDAVNVAQLKAAKVEVVAGKNISSVDADTTEGYTKYTVNAIDTTITEGSAAYNADGTGTITLNTDANGTKGTVTVTGLTDKYVDAVTFADNTLTIKRNDDEKWAISNLATKDDVSGSATHYYSVNDVNYRAANYDNTGAKGGMSLAAGAGSTANGTASTVTGAFSRIDGDGTSGMTNGFQGATAAAYGSFNVVGAKDGVAFDGVANSIIGVANKTENTNAALVFGAGNKVTNSYRPVDMATAAPLADALQKAIVTGNTDDMITALGGMVQKSGGAVLAIGGANTVDYALLSKVVGVGNTLKGTEGNESQLNMIDGFANTGTNINNVTVIGSGNTVANTNSAIVLGDKRQLTNASNSVILGSADENMATSVADATAIGHDANVTVANGVALGSGSVASVDAGVAGYDVDTEKASTNTTATWKSTSAAVSVGDVANNITRQITGVAAGMEDTDAVNVAQLKKVAEAATEAGKTTLKFTGDDASEDATIARSNGQTLNIIGGAKATDANGNSLLTDNNIGVVKDGDNALKVRLAKDLTGLNSVTVGDAVTLGTTGLVITDGPSVTTTGINAGSKVITNVKAGTADTDAVNVSQLNANKVTVVKGTNTTVDSETTANGTTYTVNAIDTKVTGGSASYNATTGAGTITLNTDANGTTGTVTVSGLQDTYVTDVTLKDHTLTITQNAGKPFVVNDIATMNDITNVSGKHTAITLNKVDPTAGKDGALGEYIGDSNLTMAVKDVDGQKVYDLKMSKDLVAGTKPGADGKNGEAGSITIIGEPGKDGTDGKNTSANITVKDGKNGLDGTDGITRIVYKDEDDKDHEIATMDDGLNFTGDTENVTIAKKLNETLSITGGITDANQLTTVDNIGVVASDSGLKVRLAKDLNGLNSVRVGGSEEGKGIYIANQDVTSTKDGVTLDKGNYITGLDNKTWDPTKNGYVSGRAATEDQLNSVYEAINTSIEANKVKGSDNITVSDDNVVSLNNDITLGNKNGTNVAISGTNGTITAGDGGSNKVAIDGTNSTITAGTGDNKVTVDGNSGLVTVGDTTKGAISIGNQTVTPKVVGADGTETDGTAKTGKYITGLENTTWNPTGEGYVADRAATEGQLKNVADNISKQISDIDTAVKSTSRVFESDSGADAQVTRKSTDPMKLKGGADANNLSDNNIGVVNNSDKTGFDIKLSKDIKGLNSIEVNNSIKIGTGDKQTIIEGDTINTGSVTTGNTTINNNGLTIVNEDSSKNITINNNNVNMGGNVIKNIGEGSEPTDAINKGQFDRAINNLGTGMNQINNRVNKLDNRVNRVGAGAAALAALHPLEFSPDAKWEVTAGVGNYRGANAIALGAFYRPNFDTMFSIGTSYGGGENMINAGVTWRIGEGETKAYPSKTVMAQEIDDLKTVVSEQQDQIEELKKLVNSLINK